MLTKADIKLYRSLLSHHGRKKTGLTICEGLKCCIEIYKTRPDLIRRAFFCGKNPPKNLFPELSLEQISKKDMNLISPVISPQGIIFILKKPYFAKLTELNFEHTDFLIILDRIQDPGNMGTIIRTLKAVGINKLFLSFDSADPFSDKVIRAATGMQFSMQIHEYNDLNLLLEELKKIGFKNVFLSDVSKGENIFKISELFHKSILLFGNEGSGLPSIINGKRFSIPMPGGIDSINVAQALTITVFEAVRRKLV
ncbi:MAG TPA: RNA methyltransferase [Victivallales bacterium]|nr:RNA methyltransferase [Victivallales bacterium]HRR28364.1 RNA methyltransferase [Victivallales bacterium]